MITKDKIKRALEALWQVVLVVAAFYSCASPAAPQGGPRDYDPPRIIVEVPSNYTTKFDYSRVIIEFDEYINLKDQQKNIIISPPITPRPTFTIKGRSVVIDIEAKLDSATTYTINFGNAIVDNNEGNALNDYTYAFSTGETVDSLVMSGLAVNVETGDTLIGALALLYNSVPDTTWEGQGELDSTLFLSKVMAVARTDSNGVFLATNLKGIDYKAYVIFDSNGNNSYEPGEELVGIMDSTLNPLRMKSFKVWYDPLRRKISATPQVTFKLFGEKPMYKQNLANSARQSMREFSLEFSSADPVIDSLVIDSVYNDSLIVQRSQFGDTIKYWIDMLHVPDTLKGRVVYHTTDSIGGDTAVSKAFNLTYTKPPKRKRNEDEDMPKVNPFSVNTSVSKLVSPEKEISFTFAYPLTMLDSSRIVLKEEIAQKMPEKMTREQRERFEAASKGPKEYRDKAFNIVRDSANILVWHLRTQLNEGLEYQLTIPDSVFVNVQREKNDTLRASFTTLSSENSAMMRLNLKGDSTRFFIMDLLDKNNNIVVKRKLIKVGTHEIKYIPAGDYKIRFTEDLNANGVWDTGSLVESRNAERIAFMSDKESGTSLFTTRDNWEMELEINLDELIPILGKQEDTEPTTQEQEAEKIEEVEEAAEKIEENE